MPVNIGKSQILFIAKRGSFFAHFCTIFGIGKSTARWALSRIGLPVSSSYSAVYIPGCISREYVINRLFFSYKNTSYFVFGRELKHLCFLRKKKFFLSNQIKSIRMRGGLPIWGQRTRTNAKTSARVSRLWRSN